MTREGFGYGTNNERKRYQRSTLHTHSHLKIGLRHNCPAKFTVLATLLSFFLASMQVVFGDIIPTNRAAVWQGNAGVEGGIPNVTTIYASLTPANTLADINNAINSCPSNQVVSLGAGTYNLSGGITIIQRNGVVLRGQGTNTILKFTGNPYLANILIEGDWRSVIWNGADGQADWTGGYAARSTNITLSSTTGLKVGMVICLDQVNDLDDVNAMNAYETTGTGIPGCGSSPGCNDCGRSCGSRTQQQYVQVKAINGTTVTISPPVAMPNWRASQSPQAWWYKINAQMCGIEDLCIDGTLSNPNNYAANISMWNTWNCWVKNVRATNNFTGSGNSSQVHIQQSGRAEVRHCYFYGTKAYASVNYGLLPIMVSSSLIEDNIFNAIGAAVLPNYAPSANVFSFNYATNNANGDPHAISHTFWFHGSHGCMNLMEGNFANGVRGDYFHGSGGYNTVFRNCFSGWEPGKDFNVYPILIEVTNRSWNVVGNLLGTTGQQNHYETLCTGANYSAAIYSAGWNDFGAGDDPRTVATLYRHGNYDTVTKSIIWSSTNADHTIPTSLIYASKPAWFGNCPWPPYDPTLPASNSATNIPAGYRAIYGVDPPVPPVCNPGPLLVKRTGTNVVISWTNTPCTYVLQYNPSIVSPNNWSNVTQTPVLSGNRYYVTNPASAVFRAYRLHQTP